METIFSRDDIPQDINHKTINIYFDAGFDL